MSDNSNEVSSMSPLSPLTMAIWLTMNMVCTSSYAGEPYQMLFGESESRLTVPEMQSIFEQTGFVVQDGVLTDTYCGDLQPTTEIVDLNQDGQKEVFVSFGNTCTSGMTGRSLSLFIKNSSGTYVNNLGFPTFDYTALEVGKDGYPDLMLGGPGFCFPVWTWTTAYEFKCNMEQAPGGCDGQGDLCPAQ